MSNIKFSMMINGLKYDTEQAVAIHNTKLNFYHDSCSQTIDTTIRWFKEVKRTVRVNQYIAIYEFIIFKGINNHYFLHRIIWNQHKIINDNTKELELDNKYIREQIIVPLSKDEAFNYYHNVSNFNIKEEGYYYDGNITKNQLISAEEAFGEIPLA